VRFTQARKPAIIPGMDHTIITSRTKFFGLIADPIGHVRAHTYGNMNLAKRGLFGECLYIPLHVAASDLARVLDGLRGTKNFGGAIVTMPHKEAIIPLLDEASPMVKLVGACNIVKREEDGRLFGENLDGEGFVQGLLNEGLAVAGRSFYLAGAGGLASAVSFALAKHGAASIVLVNRTESRAEALAARVRKAFPMVAVRVGLGAEERFDVVVNTTSVGLKEDDPPSIPDEIMRKGAFIADCIAARDTTALLENARKAGIPCQNGIPMIETQSNLILDLFGARKQGS